MVQARFGLHDLAIEDAHRAHQRPKLEVYDHSLFVVLRTAELKGGRVECGETHIFIGPGYVITVRHGASSSYAEVRKRAESKRDQMDTTIGKVGVLLRVTAKFRAHPLVAHVGGRDREAAGAEPGAAIGRATSREVRPHRPPQPTWR